MNNLMVAWDEFFSADPVQRTSRGNRLRPALRCAALRDSHRLQTEQRKTLRGFWAASSFLLLSRDVLKLFHFHLCKRNEKNQCERSMRIVRKKEKKQQISYNNRTWSNKFLTSYGNVVLE